MTALFGRLLRRFQADQQGSVLMLVGVCFLVLVAIGGAGYDFGRQQVVRLKMQQAADAAALAGAGMPQGTPDADRRNLANLYFSLNYPKTYLDVPRPTPSINVVSDANITVSASSPLLTSFIRTVNVNTLTAKGRSVALIKSDYNKIDLILAMDNSWSMNASDVGASAYLPGNVPAMRAACIAEFSSPEQLAYYTALYGFPVNYTPFCITQPSPPYPANYFGFDPVPSRINALRNSADYAANLLLNPNKNDHRVAIVKWDNMVVGSMNFTGDYATARTELLGMIAGGATVSTVGLQKALDISSGFRTNAVHAVILLTDGANNAPVEATNAASVAICNTLKSKPRTLVYTIIFGTDGAAGSAYAPTIRQFLSDCATGPNGSDKPNENLYFYTAPTAGELQLAFEKIIGSLQKVRIVQ